MIRPRRFGRKMSDPDRVTYRYKRFSIFAGPLVSVAMLVIAVALDWFLAAADSEGPTGLPLSTVIAVLTVPVVLIVFFVDWIRTRNFETTCRFRPNPPRSGESVTLDFEATMPEAPLGFNLDLARMEFGYKKAQRLWKESLAVPLERVETRDGKHRFSIKVTLPWSNRTGAPPGTVPSTQKCSGGEPSTPRRSSCRLSKRPNQGIDFGVGSVRSDLCSHRG